MLELHIGTHAVPTSVKYLPWSSDLILKDEVKDWIIPPDYDHVEAEARHLVREADSDGVRIHKKDDLTLVWELAILCLCFVSCLSVLLVLNGLFAPLFLPFV